MFLRLYYGQVLGVAGSAGRLELPVKSPAGVPLPLDTAAVTARSDLPESYGSPEISGHRCVFIAGHGLIEGTSYGADEAGAQSTAQSERINA